MSKKFRNLRAVLAMVGPSQRVIAERFGVSRQAVQYWIKHGRITYARAMQVERLTGGLVRVEDLRGYIK